METPTADCLVVYHGTDISNLGSILRDGLLKPSVTTLMPNKASLVHLSFSFSKASNYGDIIFEIPYNRLLGNIGLRPAWGELTTDEPVEIYLNDVMIFDKEEKYQELR